MHDRSSLFFDRLAQKIKQALTASKKESPEVRVEEVCDEDIYEVYLKDIGSVRNSFARKVHCINDPADKNLVGLLGNKWHQRILNKNCDFCYVIEGTIQFWLHKKANIKEYIFVGKQLVEKNIENDSSRVFTFVRGDGVSSNYIA